MSFTLSGLNDFARELLLHNWRQNVNRGISRWERLRPSTYLRSRPLMIEISPTKRCNISCIFCIKYRTKGPKDMSIERYNKIAEMLFPTAVRVSFCTGGDPLINPLMPEFITIADRYGVDSSLTTNGLELTRDVAAHFVKTPHMVQVALSFDGASKETVESIRVGVDYDLVMNNMCEFVRIKRDTPHTRAKAFIRYSAMHRNLHELPEAVRMWGELGADAIVVRYLDTIYGVPVTESLWFHKEETREVFAKAADMGRQHNIEVDLPDPLNGPILQRECHLPWRFIFIDTDGTARFCYQAWEQPIGNLLEIDDLDALWNSEIYQKIRSTVNTDDPYFPYCRICHMRRGAALETSHFHKTEESADLFSFEPSHDQRKRTADIIHLTEILPTIGPDGSDQGGAAFPVASGRSARTRHEPKHQSRNKVVGEWECKECGHITGGSIDMAPYTICPECAAPSSKSSFSAYASQAYEEAYHDQH